MSIEGRIAGRKYAEEWLSVVVSDMTVPLLDGFEAAFWEAIRTEANKHLPPPVAAKPPTEPMSDSQAKAFGLSEMPFGKYRYECVCEIAHSDPRYLLWLADSPDDFRSELKRYLANQDVQRLTQPDDDE